MSSFPLNLSSLTLSAKERLARLAAAGGALRALLLLPAALVPPPPPRLSSSMASFEAASFLPRPDGGSVAVGPSAGVGVSGEFFGSRGVSGALSV
jgi:hypothetical protein